MSRRVVVASIEVIVALAIAFFVGRLTASPDSDPAPGAVDIGFSQDMAVHHEQALQMANLAQTRGRPAVRAIANAILIGQSEEVGLLRGWLRIWDAPAAAPSPMSWLPAESGSMSMPMGDDHRAGGNAMSAMGSTSMPGMASPAQLGALMRKSGKAFDVLFLQLMIRHHEGGIEMAQYAQANAKLGVVRDAAQAMAFQQIEDIAQMRPLLNADGGRLLPAP